MITSIDLNEEYLEGAKQVLGTSSKVDTVNAALKNLHDLPRRQELLRMLSTRDGMDPDVVEEAWR